MLTSAGSLTLVCTAVAAQTITIDPSPRQTLTSFGASGAWWPNDINLFPASVQDNLTSFLFSEDGIHLSSYRYNMGADSGNANVSVSQFDRIVPSFLRGNGSYDFSADQAGVKLMVAAQQYGVPYITFFINAAPSYIADNQTCGFVMTPDVFAPFAEYIKTVLEYWTDYGINIKYISPMNEPDYAQAACTQEGMNVGPQQRAPIIQMIREALDNSSAKSVAIIADETSQISQADGTSAAWLNASVPYISNIAIHNYDFPTDEQLETYYGTVQTLTDGSLPPIKFTETCCSTGPGSGPGIFGASYDPTMTNALIVARYVWQFLTIANAQSFDWWSAVANLPCSPTTDGPSCAYSVSASSGYNAGLVYIDPNYNQTKDYTLYVTKRAWMMKHFASFHRPGSVRYDVPQAQLPAGVNAIASAISSERLRFLVPGIAPQSWSVLFMNNQTMGYNLTLALPARFARLTSLVQTTDEADWEIMDLPTVNDKSVSITVPARSLVTIKFRTRGAAGIL